MIFQGEPNLCVVDIKKQKKYRFDAKGRIEIKNRRLIGKFKRKFPVVSEAELMSEAHPYACPYCGQRFDNVGFKLAHIRAEHPKKGSEEA